MDCPVCKGKMIVTRTAHQTVRALRLYECKKCSRRFMSEDILYPIETEKGEALRLQLFNMRYENRKLTSLAPKKKPKPKRKVAGPTKPVKEGEVYLTYGEIFEKFEQQYPELEINDWRPYPLLEHSIIVWLEDGGLELAYQYWPKWGNFCLIERAKKYEQILDEAWRKKP